MYAVYYIHDGHWSVFCVLLQLGWLLEWLDLSFSYWSSWFWLLILLMLGMRNGLANMRILSQKLGWLVCQHLPVSSEPPLSLISHVFHCVFPYHTINCSFSCKRNSSHVCSFLLYRVGQKYIFQFTGIDLTSSSLNCFNCIWKNSSESFLFWGVTGLFKNLQWLFNSFCT